MATLLTEKTTDLQRDPVPLGSHSRLWQLLAETILYLVIFVALLETYFSIAGVGQQEFLQPDSELGLKHIPNKLVTWRMEGYSSERINSDGLRDTEHSLQKPPGVYRIALLGDSATEGLQVSLKDTYGKALERMLNNALVATPAGTHGVPLPNTPISVNAGACNAPLRNMDRLSSVPATLIHDSLRSSAGTHGVPLPDKPISMNTGACNAPLRNTDPLYSVRASGAGQWVRHFEVINFGCSSYSTGQQLEQYRHQVLKYEPDAVVLLYNRGDSLENVIKPGAKLSSIEPRPYFYLDNKGALCIDRSILQADSDKLRPHPVLDFLRANSRIYGVFSQAHLSLTLNDSRYRKFVSWLQSLPFAASNANPLSGRGAPGAPASRSSTSIQDPLKVTLALVHTLAAEAKSHRQAFVFMMFPNTIGDPDVDRQQKQLQKLAARDGFDFIDLLPPFQNADPDADFIQIHFSTIGHRRVAQMLFDLFQSKLSGREGAHGAPLPNGPIP